MRHCSVVHVTEKGAMEAIRDAYSRGFPAFGETCTHYLVLDTENLAKPDFEGAKYVCSPALRSKNHRDALWAAVQKGWLKCVSSDHCGFNWAEQKHLGKGDFTSIPNGAPGLQDRLQVLWTNGVETGENQQAAFCGPLGDRTCKNLWPFPAERNPGRGLRRRCCSFRCK